MFPLCLLLLPGAGPPKRGPPPVHAAIVYTIAAADIVHVAYDDRPYTRYLYSPDQTSQWRRVFQLHYNLLSRDSEIQRIHAVKPWLWRIDLRDVQWDPGTWEAAALIDPYFHQFTKLEKDTTFQLYWPGGRDHKAKGKYFSRKSYKSFRRKGTLINLHAPWLPADAVQTLRKETYSEAPVLWAPWLFRYSARQRDLLGDDNHGLGYYDFLRLKDLKDYLKFVDADVKSASQISPFGREFRAALKESRVSPQNRQIIRFQGRGSGLWATLDTAKEKDDGIAIDNLEPGQFSKREQAQEWYGAGPNGLPYFFTNDQAGVRANVVPGDKFGLHDSSLRNESNSKTLHPGISCINCHEGNILKPFKDDVRRQFRPGTWLASVSKSKKDDLLFKRLYASDIYWYLSRDSADFQRSVRLATVLDPRNPLDKGLTSDAVTKAYSRYFYRYSNDRVTLRVAAYESGVTRETFVEAMRFAARPGSGFHTAQFNSLAGFLARDPELQWVSRLTWEARYSYVQSAVIAYGLLKSKGGKK